MWEFVSSPYICTVVQCRSRSFCHYFLRRLEPLLMAGPYAYSAILNTTNVRIGGRTCERFSEQDVE
eukprot:1047436-Pleurochrysis_carterae.AAC.3